MEQNLKISGIKCDNCSYKDDSVKFEDYLEWLNKPCPDCGENLLTQKDYDYCINMDNLLNKNDKMQNLFNIINADFDFNEIGITEEQALEMSKNFDFNQINDILNSLGDIQ